MSLTRASARSIFVSAFFTFGPSRFRTKSFSKTAGQAFTDMSSASTGRSISRDRTPADQAVSKAFSG